MNPRASDFIVVVGCLLVTLLVVSVIGMACAYSRPAAYKAELLACVEQSKTLAESEACGEDVRRRYGRRDGGRDGE